MLCTLDVRTPFVFALKIFYTLQLLRVVFMLGFALAAESARTQ